MAKKLYSGRIVQLEVERVRLPNQVEIDLEVVRHPGAAAIVATSGPEVVLIHQYRFAGGGYLWEIPAGTLESAEAPDVCARRELREEAGLEAKRMTSLGHVLTTPGFCDERIHIFLAQDLLAFDTQHEADEVISEIRYVPWEDIGGMIDRGEIVDGKTLVGLYHAARRLGVTI